MFQSLASLKAEWVAACDHAESLMDTGADERAFDEADEYVAVCHAAYVAACDRMAATSVDSMQRHVSTTLTELANGMLMARADGPAGVWFACSRTSYEAFGDAVASAAYGDATGNASMNSSEALRLALSAEER